MSATKNTIKAKTSTPELMELKEVAAYLRLGERTVYALVKEKKIPCSRVTGKWLFPKRLIDLWIDQNTDAANLGAHASAMSNELPRVVAGSHDPLLEWAVRESEAGLALLTGGSRDGLARLAAGEALMAGIHLIDRTTGEFNRAAIAALPTGEWVGIRLAARVQGLVVPKGNPLNIGSVGDVARRQARVVLRQQGAGSRELWESLVAASGFEDSVFRCIAPAALTEMDLALAVREGAADTGLAIASAAKSFNLDFVPLATEYFDLVLSRRAYFTADVQRLFALVMSDAFATRAGALGGYDVSMRGAVIYNA